MPTNRNTMEEEIERRINWIKARVDVSPSIKDYIAFQMLDFAKYYHEQQVNSVDLAGVVPKVKIERHRLRDVDEEKYLSEMERLGFEFITFDTKIELSDQFRYYYFRHKQ